MSRAEGLGTEKNETEALKPWLRACDGQLAEACAAAASVLARMPAEVKRAQELDKKACDADVPLRRAVLSGAGEARLQAGPGA